MPQTFSQAELLKLAETPSTASHEAIYQWVRHMCTVPIRYDGPGDDANFSAELFVGEPGDPRNLGVTFSCFGNLCFIHAAQQPYLSVDLMEFVLHLHEWIVVSDLTAGKILYSASGECVYDSFFNFL